jgi:hypothetical protein
MTPRPVRQPAKRITLHLHVIVLVVAFTAIPLELRPLSSKSLAGALDIYLDPEDVVLTSPGTAARYRARKPGNVAGSGRRDGLVSFRRGQSAFFPGPLAFGDWRGDKHHRGDHRVGSQHTMEASMEGCASSGRDCQATHVSWCGTGGRRTSASAPHRPPTDHFGDLPYSSRAVA